jgi:hypothetical protein
MLQRVLSPACVWMRAGVIRFWLCDRDFDCENCPLDAALRAPRASGSHDPTPLGRPSPNPLPPVADARHSRR